MPGKNGVTLIDNPQAGQRFFVRSSENKTFVIFLTGNKSVQARVEVIITGKKSRVNILGIILAGADSRINLFTLQDHRKEQSVSDLLVKSVLFDKSRFYYEGLIKIARKAQKSNAYQKNQNLLMSKETWADSRPKLEILANDVRCTHGATIGKIDEEMLYYLKTRGLTEDKARALILEGFFREVIDLIPDESLSRRLSESVKQTLLSYL